MKEQVKRQVEEFYFPTIFFINCEDLCVEDLQLVKLFGNIIICRKNNICYYYAPGRYYKSFKKFIETIGAGHKMKRLNKNVLLKLKKEG